jgi:hypothetical protein
MLSNKYVLASSRTYPSPQDVQASLIPGAGDMGAILLQQGRNLPHAHRYLKPKNHPIAYYSATFTPTERNYDIYERELLAIMKSLVHWQPYLGWTKEPFTILTDHANLQYWKAP